MRAPLEREPFIQGLFEALPPPGTTWSTAERAKWFRAAVAIFGFTHTMEEEETITVNVLRSE